MRTPRNVFTIVLPVLSSLGPVFGVGHANAIPAPNAVPDSPKYYFPRHVKREIANTTLSDQPSPAPTVTSTTVSSRTDLDGFLSSLFPSSNHPPKIGDDITTTWTIEITTVVTPDYPTLLPIVPPSSSLPTVSPSSPVPLDRPALTSSSISTSESPVSSPPGATEGAPYPDPSPSDRSPTSSPTSNYNGILPPVVSLPSPSLPAVSLPDPGLKPNGTSAGTTSTSTPASGLDSQPPIVTPTGTGISPPPGLVAPSQLPSLPTSLPPLYSGLPPLPTDSLPLSSPTLPPGIFPTNPPIGSSNSLPPEISASSTPLSNGASNPLPTVVLPTGGPSLPLSVSTPTLPGTLIGNTEVLSSPTNGLAPLPTIPYSDILSTPTTPDVGTSLPTSSDPTTTTPGPGLPLIPTLIPTDALTSILSDGGNKTSIPLEAPTLSPTLPTLISSPGVNYPLPTTSLPPVPDTNTTALATSSDLPTGILPSGGTSSPTGYPVPPTTNVTTPTGDAPPSTTSLSTSTGTMTTAGAPLVTSSSSTSDLPLTGPTTGPTSPTTGPTTGPPDTATKNGTTYAYGGDLTTPTPSTLISTTTSLPWFPPSLATAQASTVVTQVVTGLAGSAPISSATTTQSAETGIPSNFPKVVTPAGGMPPRPNNGTLCRFGFTHELNYAFVVSNPIAVAQIFEYLPKGLSYGLSLASTDVLIHHLQPLDTTKTKRYITTLAFAYIPDALVDKLDIERRNPHSQLFQHPDPPVSQMMSLLDSTIPLRATDAETTGDGNGLLDDGSWLPDGGNGPETLTSDGAPLGNTGSGSVSKKSVGVGLGIVAGAAAYGAAMFFIARRYRQRRNRHTRSSSIGRSISPGSNPAGALMGSTVMHGARSPYGSAGPSHDKRGSRGSGKASARTQNISAPMMAENSLGWN